MEENIMKTFLSLILALSVILTAQENKQLKEDAKVLGPVLLLKDKAVKEVKDGQMKQYFLVLLKKGPIRDQDSATSAEIQKAHLANINRLYKEGKIDMAGPIGNEGDLRGIFIFNCDSYDEVLMLCTTDPAIKAGRLIADIYPWWAEKGSKLR